MIYSKSTFQIIELQQHSFSTTIHTAVLETITSFMTEVPIICRANQWTGFYIIGASVMKELNFLRITGVR